MKTYRVYYEDKPASRDFEVEAPDHRAAAQQFFSQRPRSEHCRIIAEDINCLLRDFDASEFMDEALRARASVSPSPAGEPNQTERPKKVQNAVTILYVTLGFGIVRAVMEASANAEMAGVGFLMFVTLVVFAVMVFLITMIGRGRNWARITFLVLFLLGLLPSILPLIRSFAISPISGVPGLAQVVLQIVAMVFLFQQESSAWFRAKTAAR